MPMHKIATTVLGFAIALHAVLGCCWHHARGASSATLIAADARHCGCHHDQPGQPAHKNDRELPSRDCCGHASCVYLKAERAPQLELQVLLDLLPGAPSIATSAASETAVLGAFTSDEPPPDPLPLFLRLGVLLI